MQRKIFIRRLANAWITLCRQYLSPFKYKYGAIGDNSYIATPSIIDGAQNIFLGNRVSIKGYCTILTVGNGKLVFKDNSGAAVGLTVVTSNHKRPIGIAKVSNADNSYSTIIVEEEVTIGAHCTLLSGAHIGRGCIIGACSVIRTEIPPYAIVIGNPAKVVGFRYKPEDIIRHEALLYPEKDRISLEVLKNNYETYYLSRIENIREYKSILV